MFSVIMSTYNAPRELDLALCGLSRQSRKPDELLIADDGSSRETRDVITSWSDLLGCECRHIWHADRGNRKTRILNEAVRQSNGDHLIFIDGDTIAHSQWLADHVQAADGRSVLCGRRVKLGEKFSQKLDRDQILKGELETISGDLLKSFLAGDSKRLLLGIRLPPRLARCFHARPRKLMGVNFSLPRKAFEAVNGFDEQFDRNEDRDLELRLQRKGIPFYPLLNRAIVYHLYHPMRPISAETKALIRAQETSDHTWCEQGLQSEEPFDPNQ